MVFSLGLMSYTYLRTYSHLYLEDDSLIRAKPSPTCVLTLNPDRFCAQLFCVIPGALCKTGIIFRRHDIAFYYGSIIALMASERGWMMSSVSFMVFSLGLVSYTYVVSSIFRR